MAKSPARWVSLSKAAEVLDEDERALRRRFERASYLKEGRVEAALDGLQARKLGRRWKVLLGDWEAANER